jgi:hypothetical protein
MASTQSRSSGQGSSPPSTPGSPVAAGGDYFTPLTTPPFIALANVVPDDIYGNQNLQHHDCIMYTIMANLTETQHEHLIQITLTRPCPDMREFSPYIFLPANDPEVVLFNRINSVATSYQLQLPNQLDGFWNLLPPADGREDSVDEYDADDENASEDDQQDLTDNDQYYQGSELVWKHGISASDEDDDHLDDKHKSKKMKLDDNSPQMLS